MIIPYISKRVDELAWCPSGKVPIVPAILGDDAALFGLEYFMVKQQQNERIDITPVQSPMGFTYGAGVFGPEVEIRRLEDIRASLRDPQCKGPEQVYSIAMDVGKEEHRALLNKLHLLFGVVTYSAGKLGQEPVRSQGHIHKISPYSGWSTPEIYEIWSGEAIIYMQEYAEDQPGDVEIVPPYWVHATISANPRLPLTFGAWCDRDYGFVYEGVRKHRGIAWFPVFNGSDELEWIANSMYDSSHLICKSPSDYISLDIRKGVSIYRQFEENPEIFLYVPNPALKAEVWRDFEP